MRDDDADDDDAMRARREEYDYGVDCKFETSEATKWLRKRERTESDGKKIPFPLLFPASCYFGDRL